MYALRVALQHLIMAASTTQEPIMTYKLSSNSQPAVQTLLKVAISLADKAALVGMRQPVAVPGLAGTSFVASAQSMRYYCNVGDVFQLLEDIVDTNRIKDVKACFSFMDSNWVQLRNKSEMLTTSVLLRFQKACNMFTRRVSNDQDAEILGAVSFQVAKMLPYNDKAGLNANFTVNNSHAINLDTDIGVSVMHFNPVCLFEASL